MKFIILRKTTSLNLFEKYSLWNFFSVMINYLFYDFIHGLRNHFDANAKIIILKDKEYRLNNLRYDKWMLIKNNRLNTINGKLRFLIREDDYKSINEIISEDRLLKYFKTMVLRLKKITGINEIDIITAENFLDPSRLGHTDKYFAVHLKIKLFNNSFIFIFVMRDEVLLYPFVRISSDFLLTMKSKYFKKAFIELDKKIIFDGYKCWGSILKKGFAPFIKDYQKTHTCRFSDDVLAYRLVVQYLHILDLYSADIKI